MVFFGIFINVKNLAKQYENEVIDEKNEEIRDIYEESDRIESDAEYGQYATEEDLENHLLAELIKMELLG